MKNKAIVKAIFMFVLGATLGVLLGWIVFRPIFFPKKKVCKRILSWKHMEYDYVKGYFFAGYQSNITGEYVSKKPNSIIDEKGRLNRAVWNHEGVDFSETDIDKLFNPKKYYDLNNTKIPELLKDYSPMFCHDPHHGIVFWDKCGCPQAYINICYTCNTIEYFPKTNFPGISLNVSRLLFKEKGIDATESYGDILAYSKKLIMEVDTTPTIFLENEVDQPPQFSSDEYAKLIDFLNSKNRNKPYVYPHTTKNPVVVELTIEPNGKVSHLELERRDRNDIILLWLWETTWQPAIKNNEKVRSKIVKVFYL